MEEHEVQAALARVEEALEALDTLPPTIAPSMRDALGALVSLYGEALARIVAIVARDAPDLSAVLAGDELVAHLLLLHGLHPDGVDTRVRRALEELRGRGQDATLVDVRDGVARVRVGSGCTSCSRAEVETFVLDAAPELAHVEIDVAPSEVLIPLDALTTRATR